MLNTLISRAVGNKMATKKHRARRRFRYVMHLTRDPSSSSIRHECGCKRRGVAHDRLTDDRGLVGRESGRPIRDLRRRSQRHSTLAWLEIFSLRYFSLLFQSVHGLLSLLSSNAEDANLRKYNINFTICSSSDVL